MHITVLAVGFGAQYDLENYMELYSEYRQVAPHVYATKEEIVSAEFKAKFGKEKVSDEEFYAWYTLNLLTDEDGNVVTTGNPQGMFDYWGIDCEGVSAKDGLFEPPSAVLTPSGWNDVYGIPYPEVYKKYLERYDLPGTKAYLLDVHQ